jgi:hypothetical protein
MNNLKNCSTSELDITCGMRELNLRHVQPGHSFAGMTEIAHGLKTYRKGDNNYDFKPNQRYYFFHRYGRA